MFSEETHARHLVELGTIKRYMDDIEITSSLIKKSDTLPLHTLLIEAGGDTKERLRQVNLNFIPLPDEEIEYIHLLQFYTILPFMIDADYKDEVEKFLMQINRLTGIGDFNLRGDFEVDFRYVYTASNSDLIPQAEVSEILFLYVFMLDIYAELIEAVGDGEKTSEQALKELHNPA